MNIEDLEKLPENFAIGRDEFGWRYTTNANAGANVVAHTGFPTFQAAMEHYFASGPKRWWKDTFERVMTDTYTAGIRLGMF
jgi:hypothetical protein